jgi:two-component system response regulator YesN
MGFTCYKNKIKIDYAKRLFNETDKSIKEISKDVGFLNLNYFYRLFRESTGVTPKQYQENVRSVK